MCLDKYWNLGFYSVCEDPELLLDGKTPDEFESVWPNSVCSAVLAKLLTVLLVCSLLVVLMTFLSGQKDGRMKGGGWKMNSDLEY